MTTAFYDKVDRSVIWKVLSHRVVQQRDSFLAQSSKSCHEALAALYWMEAELLDKAGLQLACDTGGGLHPVRVLLEVGVAAVEKARENPAFSQDEQLYLVQQETNLRWSLTTCNELLDGPE